MVTAWLKRMEIALLMARWMDESMRMVYFPPGWMAWWMDESKLRVHFPHGWMGWWMDGSKLRDDFPPGLPFHCHTRLSPYYCSQ